MYALQSLAERLTDSTEQLNTQIEKGKNACKLTTVTGCVPPVVSLFL